MQIKTVLCPIDFSTLSDFELKLAVEVCRAYGARLVLHHNLAAAAAGLHKAWEWEQAHEDEPGIFTEPEAREHMKDVLDRISADVVVEARISRGPMGLVLLHLIHEIKADLVILGSHGWSSDEHSSLSERIIESAPCPVLTIQEGKGDRHAFHLRATNGDAASKVLVPTDFSESAGKAVAYALELARRSPLQVHLLHVQSGRRPSAAPVNHVVDPAGASEGTAEETRRKLLELVPADLAERVECHVEVGKPADEIMAEAKKLDAELIVMGEHARGFFRRFFTHDTSRDLLHGAGCPVWFVPAGYAV
ncbi:MAG: universal stress protein [bacterium]|nr:universal stress protein [bacterium]